MAGRLFATGLARLRHVPALGAGRRFLGSVAASDLVDPLIGLTEEQAQYYTVAADFAKKELLPHAAKWDEEKIFPAEALRAAAGLGFGALYCRADVGGSEMKRAEGVPIVEALSTACPSTTAFLTIHNMVAWMIDTWGSKAQREAYLPRMASMEIFGSYCLTEPGAGSDAASLRTRATRDAATGEWVLSGSKAFISGGGRSDLYLVMARTGGDGAGGISAFLVPNGTPGLSFGAQEVKMGWNSQPTAAVFFDGMRLPADALLGKEGDGFKYAMKGLDGGRLSIAACSLGAATACFDIARDHVKVRKQFGAPLSANQSVAFTLADMATDLISARMMTRQAAAMLDAGDANARAFCAMAKRTATDKGFDTCNRALQLLGGYGYLRSYGIERYLRDARVHQILEGTNQIMNVIVSRQLLA